MSTALSAPILANGVNLGLPLTAIVAGVVVSFSTGASGTGSPSVNIQLASNGTAIGSPVNVPISGTISTYTQGGPAYQWGTTLTPDLFNGPLGILVTAELDSIAAASATFNFNTLTATVYYLSSALSDVLIAQSFSFVLSDSSGVSGFFSTFKAYSTGSTSISLQLLNNGVPVGDPKTIQLTSASTLYQLGGANDPWGYPWTAANVNSLGFGVQITATGTGTSYVGDLDITTFITPALENFNWIGSYEQQNDALTTLALDAGGNMWKEDPVNNPGVLSLTLAGLLPGSYANGATLDNSEFVMFSDLTVGTDRPRQLYSDGNWYPVTQVGPGAPPRFLASTGSLSGLLTLKSYAWTAGATPGTGTVVLTYATASVAPTVGSIYVISGTGTALDGQAAIVSGSPAPTTAAFTAEVTGTYGSGTITVPLGALLTPQFFYEVASITETLAITNVSGTPRFVLSAGPGVTTAGNNVTVYYSIHGLPIDTLLQTMFASGNGLYIYISNAVSGQYNFNGVWQVTAVGQGNPPGVSQTIGYFCFTYVSSGTLDSIVAGATFKVTQATVAFPSPGILGLSAGQQFTITGVTGTPQSGWNGTWTTVEALNSGQYIIDTTYSDGTTATYTYSYAGSNNQDPISGNYITITGALQNQGYNGTFIIATVNTGAHSFTVANLGLPATVGNPVDEHSTAQAIMSGTQFTFDPGETFVGTNTNVIYGNTTYAVNNGQVTIIGNTITPIGAGTRNAFVFFITKTGEWTPASPILAQPFTTPSNANLLNVSNIPIGPPNVVARGIAITEAGANGVPGANYYVIERPVTLTVNGVTTTYSSTIINNNTDTTASLSFTDAVLLNSTEVDIPGFDLFNLIELGSCAWCVPYSSRMFYGMQLNKVQNFDNLTFDGGSKLEGWGLYPTANEIQLVNSPVTGMAYYVSNTTGSTQAQMGLISQTAYQDIFNVAIINANTAYSVRVAASNPSGVSTGNLVIDLTDLNGGNFGKTYGSFTVPLSSMSSLPKVFSGTLLNNGIFTGNVSPILQLRMSVQNMGVGADVLVDRIEVFPTLFPYLKTEVYGSYINKPEWVDASGDGGIIDTSTENPQTCYGAAVLRDSMYLLKTSSMYVTKDNPNSEPGGWSLNEISNRVGACGINAYDVGEEWIVTACRNGIFGFTGTSPELINLEILQVWNAINWNAGHTICLRNDTENRRILCAVPLPTGTSPEGVPTATIQWLPYAPYNPAPLTPNVMLVLNYQAIGSFEELMHDISVHTTMYGSLAAPDMRRKWTIWTIPTPYMGAVLRANLVENTLMVCNGIASSKIYQFDINATSDDGSAIYGLYTTYSFVNAQKAVTMPILGMHNKRYTVLQFNAQGEGGMNVKMYPNDLNARYPLTVPLGLPYGISLSYPVNDDYVRPINIKGQRVFLEFSTYEVGAWFELCKVLITGKQDNWSPISPTGGGNAGIV